MRMGVGLLSLLIGVAFIFYLSIGTKSHPGIDATALEAGKKAREEASQITGKTEDNVPIKETYKVEEVDSGGQFRRVRVVSIVPGTPMETIYGLKAGDEITRVGDLGVADNNDFGLAEANIEEAYGRNSPLVILRNGEQMTLTPSNSPLSKMNVNNITKPLAPPISPIQVPGGQAVPGH